MVASIVITAGEIEAQSRLQILWCFTAEIHAVLAVVQAGIPTPADAIAGFIEVSGALGLVKAQR